MENDRQDVSPELQKVLNSSGSFLGFVKSLLNLGFKTIKQVLVYSLLFSVLNIVSLVLSVYKFSKLIGGYYSGENGLGFMNVLCFLGVFLVSGLVLFVVIYSFYSAIRMEFAYFVYKQSSPLMYKICNSLITKVESSSNKKINKADISKIVSSFTSKFPKLLGKMIVYLFSLFSLTNIFVEIFSNKQLTTNDQRTNFMTRRVDIALRHYFEEEKQNWLLSIFIINLVLQLVLLYGITA